MKAKTVQNFKRKDIFKRATKVVIKVGTRLLTDLGVISDIISQIAVLKERGLDIILVSSGAVGLGIKTLGLAKRPKELSEIQALAAIGQSKLMSLYEKESMKYGFHCAQILLGADDLEDRERHLNILNCLNSLLAMNVLPVINENDTVSVDELKFGDNDKLAALIAVMFKADLTIILTTIDGLMTKPEGGELISVVNNLDNRIKTLAGGSDDNNFSTGGMLSKIKAAEIVVKAGEYMIIASGRDKNILLRLFEGEELGTLFLPHAEQMNARRRWFGFFSKERGKIFIDDGAAEALIVRRKSLLPSGVKKVEGKFSRGDTVLICRKDNGEVIAKGLVNYSDEETNKIAGRRSSEFKNILGYSGDEELIHRDNMTIIV